MQLFKDNLFNADHRTNMIAQYGYSDAMSIALDDLCYQWTMEAEDHDCNQPSKGYCRGCETLDEVLKSLDGVRAS